MALHIDQFLSEKYQENRDAEVASHEKVLAYKMVNSFSLSMQVF